MFLVFWVNLPFEGLDLPLKSLSKILCHDILFNLVLIGASLLGSKGWWRFESVKNGRLILKWMRTVLNGKTTFLIATFSVNYLHI